MPTLPWFARGDLGKCARKRGGVWYWCYGVLKTRLLWSVAERPVCARGNRPTERWNEQSRQWRFQEYALLLVLRQEPARGAQAHRRPDRFHLRRMRRIVHGHHPSKFDLFRVKCFIILRRRAANRVMVRIHRLDQHHTNKNYGEKIQRLIMRSNEEDISYGAVSWQGWLDLGRVPCGQHGH